MRSNSFAALGSADAGASPSSTTAPLDAHEGSPPRGGGGAGVGGEAFAPASSARRRRPRSRAASTPAEDSTVHHANNDLLDASSLSFRFASECEAATTALGGSANRLLKTTSIDRALGIEASNSVERSSESAGSLSSASLMLPLPPSSSCGGVLSDGGGGGEGTQQQQQAGGGSRRAMMIPSLPTIAASPLGPSSLGLPSSSSSSSLQRPRSSPTKEGGRGSESATVTAAAAAAASAQNPSDGFVTPRGSPWAPAPLEAAAAEGGGGGGGIAAAAATTAAAAAAAAAPRRSAARNSGGSASTPPRPQISSFRSYLHGELHPTPSLPTADVAWGQTERQRVYNALLAVPAHLERLLLLGGLVCADAWLAVLTLLPLRLGMALVRGLRWVFTRGGRGRGKKGSGKKKNKKAAEEEVDDNAEAEEEEAKPSSSTSNPGALLYDLLCFLIFLAAALTCCAVPVGALYFWMKDMTQEFLKLHVIYTAVDILDKIACSFSVDALDALAGTCALIAAAPTTSRRRRGAEEDNASSSSSSSSSSAAAATLRTPRSAAAGAASHSSAPSPASRLSLVPHLLADSLVAGAIVTAHAFVLLAHGVALSVAMHSKRGSTLLALTFASNFVEIKSAVFKRYDGRKLYTLACQDCVERFHLLTALAFVLVEAAAAGKGGESAAEPAAGVASSSSSSSSFSFWSRPDTLLLTRCGHVFAAEVAIDVIKHAVLSKFNEVRPGMYREFARDVASAAADERPRGHSHALYRRLLFDPLAPAALVIRMLVTAARARRRQAIAAAVAAANAAGGAEALSEVAVSVVARGVSVGSSLLSVCSSALSLASTVAAWLLLWVAALAVKVALGFGLRVGCAAYLKHYDRRHGGLKRE